MSQVMIIKNSRPDIGLYTRPATLGSEYELVEQFIEYYCNTFICNNKKNRLAVFVEPRIDSGFPDVVFASYLPSITDNWSQQREALDVFDLKLLSYLCSTENVTGKKIISTLGFPEKQTLGSLEKLMDSKLVSYRSGSWRVRELCKVFSLTKLIAVEAKLNDIEKLVEQTHLNTRFASHSYALTNSAHPQGTTVNTFKCFGLGLYGKDTQFRHIVKAKPFSIPSSYLSFQFNEWIGKSLIHQEGMQYA
jgi:hypothetical protein